jgi:hypothetical protein
MFSALIMHLSKSLGKAGRRSKRSRLSLDPEVSFLGVPARANGTHLVSTGRSIGIDA